LPVGIVADDLLSGIAPRHDMVDGTLEFDAKSSWHDPGPQHGGYVRLVPTSVPCGARMSRRQEPKTRLGTAKPPKTRLGTAKPPLGSIGALERPADAHNGAFL
jgi:hypothetical protein